MAVEGAIAERVRGIIPITWDALSRDSRYGDPLLRSTIDIVKQSVFGTVVAPAAEAAYPLLAIDYAAKLVAIELCNPGIDFWMNELLSESATGTNENHTFVNRAEELRQLRKTLIEDTRRVAGEIAALVGYTRKSTRAPASSTIDLPFITADPIREFPRPYRETDFT